MGGILARTKNPKHLLRARRRWYAVLDVPEDVRVDFDGQARFKKTLRTESLTIAERRVGPVISAWKQKIERARLAKSDPSAAVDAIALEWREDYMNASPDQREVLDEVLEQHIDGLKLRNARQEERVAEIVTGQTFPTTAHLNDWLDSLDNTAKTKDMKASDVERMAQRLPYTSEITRESLSLWIEDLTHTEKLSRATVNRILSACHGYWNFLQRRTKVSFDNNPFFGIGPSKSKRSKQQVEDTRVAFEPSEVSTLLEAALQKGDGKLAIVIWIAMWTGARIEEICSLRVENFSGGHIEITDAKSPAGWRSVPVHQKLKPALEALSDASTDGFLISNLSKSKYKARSNAVGKRSAD